jgi:enoyl-CoA hydratase/3-hydroxypropionyl-coenzyme A dehydratase
MIGSILAALPRMNATEYLSIEKRESLLWIRLDRAEKANALTVGMMEGAAAALQGAAEDDSVRGILLAGAGEKVFSGGVDVREKPADGDIAAHRRRRSAALSAFLDGLLDTPKPVIAVLNGIASGGGAMLALCADARVAVDSAEISLPEINLGMPTFPGAAIATQVGGVALATDLVQTGRRMPAAEALARGLLTSVVPRAELEQEAMRVAALFVQKDPAAFAANKRWLNRGIKAALAEARTGMEEHRSSFPREAGIHAKDRKAESGPGFPPSRE